MINPGTLVLTAEGYYAIVLERPTSDGYVDIFTCNGLHLIEQSHMLEPLGLKHDSPSNDPPAMFHEILKVIIRRRCR